MADNNAGEYYLLFRPDFKDPTSRDYLKLYVLVRTPAGERVRLFILEGASVDEVPTSEQRFRRFTVAGSAITGERLICTVTFDDVNHIAKLRIDSADQRG